MRRTESTDLFWHSLHGGTLLVCNTRRGAVHATRIDVKIEELHVDELLLVRAQCVVIPFDEALQGRYLFHDKRVTVRLVWVDVAQDGFEQSIV